MSDSNDEYEKRERSPNPRHKSRSISKSVSRSRSRSIKSASPRRRSSSVKSLTPRRSYSRSRSRSRSYHRRSRSGDRYNRNGGRRGRYSRSRSRTRSRSRSFGRRYTPKRYSRSPMSSRRRHIGDRLNPPVGKCLGVFGLSLFTSEGDLRDIFSKYGRITSINVVIDQKTSRSRGFGFVYFENEESASEAKERANGMEVDGRRIRVDFSITKRAHTPTPGIYVGRPSARPPLRDDYRDDHRDYRRDYRRSPSPYYHRRRSPSPPYYRDSYRDYHRSPYRERERRF